MFNRLKLDYDVHPLYHRTSAFISKLDEQFLQYETTWHNNGAIGLWCSTYPQMCRGFGDNCYLVKLKPDVSRYGLSLEDLKKLSWERQTRQAYSDLRQHCLDTGIDVLYVVDRNPFVGEVIIVNYDKVQSLELVESPGDKDYRLEVINFD